MTFDFPLFSTSVGPARRAGPTRPRYAVSHHGQSGSASRTYFFYRSCILPVPANPVQESPEESGGQHDHTDPAENIPASFAPQTPPWRAKMARATIEEAV